MTVRIVKRLFLRTLSLARVMDFWYTGIAMLIRITMMVMTTINSTKVKPRRRLPLGIGRSIGCLFGSFGIHVEDVLTAPTVGLGVVLRAPQPPLLLAGKRVFR